MRFSFFNALILLVMLICTGGCPQRLSKITIPGKSIIDGKFYDATMMWDRNVDKVQILVDRRFETGFVSQYEFNLKIGSFTGEIIELDVGHRSFFYKGEVTAPQKRVVVHIEDSPLGNSQGWPCSHTKDNLLMDIDVKEVLTETVQSDMRFSADYVVDRTNNPFNSLRYQLHPCP